MPESIAHEMFGGLAYPQRHLLGAGSVLCHSLKPPLGAQDLGSTLDGIARRFAVTIALSVSVVGLEQIGIVFHSFAVSKSAKQVKPV